MNDCFWCFINGVCEGDNCNDCKDYLSVNSGAGMELLNKYEQEVEKALKPLAKKWKWVKEHCEKDQMTKTELFIELHKRPNVKFVHRLFSSDEYLINKEDGCIYDENGYLFENFDLDDDTHNGMRIRRDSVWDDGWTIIN